MFNDSHKKRKKTLTLDDLISIKTPYPTVVVPLGSDGSVHHEFCVVNDLVFDSTQSCALKCTLDTIGWVCDKPGKRGKVDVFKAFRFNNPFGCQPLKRGIKVNWIYSGVKHE